MNKARNSALAAFAAATLLSAAAHAEGTVNIYTYRQPELIQPVLDAFTAETGIKTEVLFLDKGLEERVQAEGTNSPVDVIMTVDIARLTKAKEAGITQALDDETVNGLLPAEYRDPEGHWFGLTKRARVVYASKDRVTDSAITYAELADPKWKGKLCMRSGQHDYNLALISAAIAHWGPEKTEEWLKGVKANLARKPDGGDRPQAGAIFAGECDIALGNTYYVGLMRTNEKEPKEKDWGNAINVLFPTFENGGTHVNISGIALAKNAPNRDNAVKLIQFLASGKAQQIYAEKNYEYPVEPGLEPSDMVKSFGTLNPDTLPLAEIAKNRKAASEMVDRVALDDGPSS
jgi:iron(III) transport system substrate-binding protein